jgi:hypothetical protein
MKSNNAFSHLLEIIIKKLGEGLSLDSRFIILCNAVEFQNIILREFTCAERWWAWNDGERKRWRRIEFRWHGALAREEVKWRRDWVMGEWSRLRCFFITMEDMSQTVREGWPVAVVRIKYFSFDSREKATGWSIVERWSGGSELLLTQ